MGSQRRNVICASALLVVVGLGAGGCGRSGEVASPADQATTPYAGPLHLAPAERTNEAERTAGAAGRVVECTTRVSGRIGRDPYEGGAMSSPDAALEAAASEVGYVGHPDDFVRERSDDTRVLYTYRVGAKVTQAMIVAIGPTFDGGKTGWHAETWARCDLSEFPDAVMDASSQDRWSDRNGSRVPTYEISSGPGPEHCDWQTATFLHLDGRTYIGNAPDSLVPEYVPDTYARSVPVPADATDTGYVRDGSHLWIAADRNAAYVGSEDSAERWPGTAKEFGCA